MTPARPLIFDGFVLVLFSALLYFHLIPVEAFLLITGGITGGQLALRQPGAPGNGNGPSAGPSAVTAILGALMGFGARGAIVVLLAIWFGIVGGCSWLSGAKVSGPGGVGLELDGPQPAGASSVSVANKDSHATTESKRISIGTVVVNIQKCGDAGITTALADVVADAGGEP